MSCRKVQANSWVARCAIAGLALSLLACGRRASSETAAAPVALPKPPAVGDAPGAWVLRYFAPATGKFVAVRTPAEVPEGARGQVIVVPEDPALQGPWLYVADFTKKSGATYAVRTVDRMALEQQIAKANPPPPAAAPAAAAAAAAAPAAAAAGQDVVVYRTAWCGYCKKTAEYLKLKGVPFVEKDLERDPGAREEMLARAQRAGIPASQLQGVPIIAIGNHVITGFSREAIDKALGV